LTLEVGMADLSIELAPHNKRGLLLANPVMTASGTFGYGTEYAELVDIQRLGAIICKGTTLRPRKGNAPSRTVETPAGMLNSIGLQNIGVGALVREMAPVWSRWSVPVIVNIAGESVDEYRRIASTLEGADGVAGIEVNVSCPNVAGGGMVFGIDSQSAAEVTAAVKMETTLPVMVKLTPNVSDIVAIARAVEDAGADAISLINTLVGMVIDIKRRRPVLGTGRGGLSGPAIKPVALAMVYQVAGAVSVPVVGVGGISTANDALEFFMAGASAVQIGTASFVNPTAALEVVEGVEAYLENRGVQKLADVIGTARQDRASVVSSE
jgi:dihydroorotate dehydrogenase (NAD+) catalytic subunit